VFGSPASGAGLYRYPFSPMSMYGFVGPTAVIPAIRASLSLPAPSSPAGTGDFPLLFRAACCDNRDGLLCCIPLPLAAFSCSVSCCCFCCCCSCCVAKREGDVDPSFVREIASETISSDEEAVMDIGSALLLAEDPAEVVRCGCFPVPAVLGCANCTTDEELGTFGKIGEVGAVELALVEGDAPYSSLLLRFFIFSILLLPILAPSAPLSEILDMWKLNLSIMGDVPRKEEDGDGRG